MLTVNKKTNSFEHFPFCLSLFIEKWSFEEESIIKYMSESYRKEHHSMVMFKKKSFFLVDAPFFSSFKN